MSQATIIAIAKTPLGEIHIQSHGSTEYAFLKFYRNPAIKPLTMAEIGQIIETVLDDSFEDVENEYGLDQNDIEYPHFLGMTMRLQAELFQQKYELRL